MEELNIAWSRADSHLSTRGKAGALRHPSPGDRNFDMVTGFCDVDFRKCTEAERQFRFLELFHTMVIGDGVDPVSAHTALLNFKSYCVAIGQEREGYRFSPSEVIAA